MCVWGGCLFVVFLAKANVFLWRAELMKIHITLLTKAVFRIVEEWMGSMLRADIPIFLILREKHSVFHLSMI